MKNMIKNKKTKVMMSGTTMLKSMGSYGGEDEPASGWGRNQSSDASDEHVELEADSRPID